MHSRLLVLSMVFLLATTSFAAEWVTLGTNGKKETYSVDKETISRKGELVTAWVKWQHIKPETHYTPGTASSLPRYEFVDYTLFQYEFDCRELTVGVKMVVGYSEKNKKRVTSEKISLPSHEPVVPDSIASQILKQVCDFTNAG